jgi:outer membrane lipoprotein carrier protein
MRASLIFRVLIMSAALLLAAMAPSRAEPPSPVFPPLNGDELVHAIERHYSGLTDLTAKVVQKNFLRSVGKTQRFEGILSIKKPGKLRLEYTNGQVIVIDGKVVWFYSRTNAQVIRRTFEDFEQANIPVAFLLGAGTIDRDFNVVRLDAGEGAVLELVPKKRGAAMTKLRIIADEDGRITRMIIFDRSGNTSDILFAGVKENTGIDEGQFRFKVPKGTEIIEQ